MTGKVKEKIIRKPKGLKVTEIIGVNKKGEPIEADIDNFDEQVARKEFEAEYDEPYDDPMDLQHERKERWDR